MYMHTSHNFFILQLSHVLLVLLRCKQSIVVGNYMNKQSNVFTCMLPKLISYQPAFVGWCINFGIEISVMRRWYFTACEAVTFKLGSSSRKDPLLLSWQSHCQINKDGKINLFQNTVNQFRAYFSSPRMCLNLHALIFHHNTKKEGRRSAYRQTSFWVARKAKGVARTLE